MQADAATGAETCPDTLGRYLSDQDPTSNIARKISGQVKNEGKTEAQAINGLHQTMGSSSNGAGHGKKGGDRR